MTDFSIIAFDCDGVMFDTTNANMAYYNQILNHFGLPDMTKEQFDYCHMHTADQAITRLFSNEKSRKAANDYRKKMSYIPFLKYMEIEPYLKPLLSRLKPRYKTAVATNRSDTMNSVISVHGLEGYFDIVVSSIDVVNPKPHPDPLIKILDYFKAKPENLLYIGDSELDQLASRAAGVSFASYDNPALDADFHVTNLKEIENILNI